MTDNISPRDAASSAPQVLAVVHLALLAAAWRWTKEEAAQAAGITAGQIDHYTSRIEPMPESVTDTIAALFRIQYHLWSTRPFGDYADWWRRLWRNTSPIGAQSPLEAIMAEGRPAIDRINAFYDAMLAGDFS